MLNREGLRVAIGLPSAVMLVIGGIVGVGIFVNPAVVARSLHSPLAILSAWTLGGVIALLGAFVYAELAARMPATGGEYVYLRDTYGSLPAFLFGWTMLLVVHAGGMAAVAIIFASNLNRLLGGALPEPAVAVSVLAALAAINCAGVQNGNGTQAALGCLKLLAIAALIGVGMWLAPPPPRTAAAPPTDTLKSFGAAMIAVVFSYGGWQTANYAAGEIKQSGRNLARALLLGVGAVIALYLLVNFACLRALGTVSLAATLTPAADILQRAAGPEGARLAAAAIALSALGYLSQAMLTGPRVIFAMARDGMFFRRIAQLGDTSQVPVAATMLLAAWTMVLALSGTYEQIVSYDIAINFLFFGVNASCLFALRRREASAPPQEGYRAFGHPWTTSLFMLACTAIVASSLWSYPARSLIGYGILLLGIPPYLYWRRQTKANTLDPT